MKKVLVIGSPGAGKSMFAKALHGVAGLPLYHLDLVWYGEDNKQISREDFDLQLVEILRKPEWILDGNYQRTMEMRVKACDTIFLLDYPTEVCLAGIEARVGQKRDDFRWVDREANPELVQKAMDFSRDKLPKIYELMKKYNDKDFVIFKTRGESQRYLERLGK